MTTNIIDPSLHASTFPSAYTGPGTLIGNPIQSGGVVEMTQGFFTSNGNATQINVGFQALEVEVVNTTDGLCWEWQYGMPIANSIKITLGTVAAVQDTSSQITVATDKNGVGTVTLGATLCGTSKNISYKVRG